MTCHPFGAFSRPFGAFGSTFFKGGLYELDFSCIYFRIHLLDQFPSMLFVIKIAIVSRRIFRLELWNTTSIAKHIRISLTSATERDETKFDTTLQATFL